LLLRMTTREDLESKCDCPEGQEECDRSKFGEDIERTD
jgi:hypothetical protein